MKRIIVILLAVLPLSSFAQRRGVYTDLVLEKLRFTDLQDVPLNADMLEVGKVTRIGFRVVNANMDNAVPAGTCKLKLTLGMNCFPTTDLQGAEGPLPDYFRWTQSTDPFNQIIITGELYKSLPAGFSGDAVFTVMPSKPGQSVITGHFLITNHKNPLIILSDLNSNNNIISSGYTNLSPLAMKFIDFNAKAKSCTLDINWRVSDESRISRFVIENSTDGIYFTALKSISPDGTGSYSSAITNIPGGNMIVRIKAESQTGQLIYSGTAAVNNICTGRFELALYPNPVIGDITELTIFAKEGIFNGKYSIRLLDASGKEISRKEVQLSNQDQVKYTTGFLAGGSYQLMMTREDGETRNLRFVKQ